MSAKERILQHARDLFLKYGVKSITLDEIAKDLGISKKTIYQYFDNKASIVYEVTQAYFEAERAEIEHIEGIAENAIDELVKICIWTAKTLENMSPRLMYEVNKYYPKSFEIHEAYIGDFVLQKLNDNLSRGIAEGLYRENIDPDLVARIRVSQFMATLQEKLFPPNVFDIWEVQIELFFLFMYGIVTDSGRELLETFLPLIPRKKIRHSKPISSRTQND